MPRTHPTAVLTLLLAGVAPAHAGEGVSGEPSLRPPAATGAPSWASASALTLHAWAAELSARLALMARSPLPELAWHPPVAAPFSLRPVAEPGVRVDPGLLTAHWRPWAVGHWRLGAALGWHRPVSGSTGVPARSALAAMPVASYEQAHYRVQLGLVPPQGDNAASLVFGLSLPLR